MGVPRRQPADWWMGAAVVAAVVAVSGLVAWVGGVVVGAWLTAAVIVELVGLRWSNDGSSPLHVLDLGDAYKVPGYERPPGGPGWKVRLLRYGFCLALLVGVVVAGDWTNGVVLAAVMVWIWREERLHRGAPVRTSSD